jgi:hypothetical protein
VICRLTGLAPLSLFPVLAPALLLLTTLAAYALATRLWGWEYGLAGAAVAGLVQVGPYVSFAGGLYPDLIAAFFLMIMVIAALVTLYQSPSLRSGFLVAAVGAAPVLYHSVGTLYLVLLLAVVAVVCLPYLWLRGGDSGRAVARTLFLALAALGALSVVYAWHIYGLAKFFGQGTSTRATVSFDVGSQSVLSARDVLAWVGSPLIWLGVFGFVALAVATRCLARPEQVATALTVQLWGAMMYLGSRTALDGFPQRFERDVGAPLSMLSVLGLGLIAESLLLVRVRAARRAQVLLAYSAAAVVVAIAVIVAGGNLVTGSRPARSEVLTRSMAAAGTWLKRHNNGGTIISTPEFNRGITNRAVWRSAITPACSPTRRPASFIRDRCRQRAAGPCWAPRRCCSARRPAGRPGLSPMIRSATSSCTDSATRRTMRASAATPLCTGGCSRIPPWSSTRPRRSRRQEIAPAPLRPLSRVNPDPARASRACARGARARRARSRAVAGAVPAGPGGAG